MKTNDRMNLLVSCAAMAAVSLMPAILLADNPGGETTIVEFAAPSAGQGPGPAFCYLACPGTIVENNNAQGTVTGYDVDGNGVFHGFVRARDGKIAVFDAPSAGTVAGTGTFASSINSDAAITGYYVDRNNVAHGYIRDRDGQFTTFDAPDAWNTPSNPALASRGTVGQVINGEGTVAGYYNDANGMLHGFVRASHGAITEFDAPNSANGTIVGGPSGSALNAEGFVTGWSFDANYGVHGYLRHPDGSFETIDIPGAGSGSAPQGTWSASINDERVIVGFYVDSNIVAHGFLRAPNGAITTFDAPRGGTTAGNFFGTVSAAINFAGVIAGYVVDNANVAHGFTRTPEGVFKEFDAPGEGTNSGQGSVVFEINQAGDLAGWYTTSQNVNHGFIVTHDR
jgi:hypothetical protein